MRAFIVLFVLISLISCVYILNRKVCKVREGFNVLGGVNDVRFGQVGSTSHNSTTKGAWISVAKFVNSAANQNHALTLEIYPRNRKYGSTRQSFSVSVANNAQTQDSDPVFVQQNIYDALTDATSSGPSFTTAALVWTQTSAPINNTYELFLKIGVENGFGFPCAWYLNDFQTTDVVAVTDTPQVATLPTGKAVYTPRLIGGPADPKTIGVFPTLMVGDNDRENMIKFKGVSGDGGTDGGNTYNHTVISERLWGTNDQSEMLLFKGNDPEACGGGTCGPDRIRVDSTGDVQVQTGGGYRTYDPMNNAGQTVLHARDDGRVSIGMQGQGKAGQKDRPTWNHNPYNDRIGAPTTYIDRLEVGGDPQGNNKTPAVLRIHQWGSGAGEFYKPPGGTIFLRETPNGGTFNNFNVQVPMTTQNIDATGNVMARSSKGQFLEMWPDDGAVIAKTGSNFRFGHADDTNAANWSEKIRITPDGKMGVGTQGPATRLHVAGDTTLDGGTGVTNKNSIEFGRGIPGKETNAGKIAYNGWTTDSLDVVGAGPPGQSRKIRLYDQARTDKLQLGDKWVLSGVGDGQANDDWLRFTGSDGKNYSGGIAAGKGWFGGDLWAGTVHAGNTDDAINRVNAGNAKCRTAYSDWQDNGNGNSRYLDRLNVACSPGEALSGFQAETSGPNMRYRMNCCRP